ANSSTVAISAICIRLSYQCFHHQPFIPNPVTIITIHFTNRRAPADNGHYSRSSKIEGRKPDERKSQNGFGEDRGRRATDPGRDRRRPLARRRSRHAPPRG